MLNRLSELLAIRATGLSAALVCRRVRFRLLVGYLVAGVVAGVVVGKGVFGWVTDDEHEIAHWAEAGVLCCCSRLAWSSHLVNFGVLGGTF